MASAVKRKLSGTDGGTFLSITNTATPGNLIHTAIASSVEGSYDEIWLYILHNGTETATVTIEFGSVNIKDNIIVNIIPNSGLSFIIPGLILQNSKELRIFSDKTGVSVGGFVNRISD